MTQSDPGDHRKRHWQEWGAVNLFVFGMGYCAQALATRLRAEGWTVRGTGRAGDLSFTDAAGVTAALAGATHVLSS
ncbi:hypothetical protein ACE4Z5_27040, partial [Salmonella enterica]|uniref:hypothetical protein n=1 Tax=Salmonella enterica TaxID=28901 RepID=UPI003D2971E1